MGRTAIAILAAALMATPAMAQEIPPLDVTAAGDNKGTEACSVTHRSAKAAVESELRKNNVELNANPKSDGLFFYVELIAVGDDDGCAVAADLILSARQPIAVSATNERILTHVTFCTLGSLTVGPTYSMQREVNESLRDLTNQCLSEYGRREVLGKGK